MHAAFVLSVQMQNPQFAGQTKERLSSRECRRLRLGRRQGRIRAVAEPAPGSRRKDRAVRDRERARAHARGAASVTRKRIVSGPALPGKLADCSSQEPERCELFLVEGDSAGGSAKQARDREFQAVMPLRGKILNTWEVDAADILASQEVHDIAIALGVDPGSTDLEGLRYHKVCILADADSDGAAHRDAAVRAVPAALPRRWWWRDTSTSRCRRCFASTSARTSSTRSTRTRRTASSIASQAEGPRGKPMITRFKGLGEMSPLQLRETTMAPETRRLVQLTIDAKDDADQVMDMLLAKKRAADRREWLESKGNLARHPEHEGPATRLRRHRASAAAHLHGEGVPRLLDVRDPRSRAAAARRRAEAGAAPHRLRDERARARARRQAQEIRAHRRRRDRQVPSARRLRLLRGDGADGAAFSYRYPLVDGQGNWGSTDDPKSFAAMRYTESRLHAYAEVLLAELGQGTVDWVPNFDGTLEEPKLLPARLPNVLLNGTHRHRGRHGDRHPAAQPARKSQPPASTCSTSRTPRVRDLCKHVRGPDFPTGAEIITPRSELRAMYETGNGTFRARAVYEDGGGRDRHHGAALPGVGRQGAGADRRADAREEAADGRGPARRVGPREPDPARDRAALQSRRRRAADGAPVRDHRPGTQLPRQPERDRPRRPPEGHGAQGASWPNGWTSASTR